MNHPIASAALFACLAGVACGHEENAVSPSSTAMAVTPTTQGLSAASTSYTNSFAVEAGGPTPEITVTPFHILHPVQFPMDQGVVAFPPRSEPNVFFGNLQALYRDVLRRPQTAPSYVDPEGENVWLTEYFRFYLNGCSHQEAMSRTLGEIRSGGTQPVCGGETLDFPPRNMPNEFQGQLENTYRDVLGRPQMLSYVDTEGANVWLAQYLRFRVSGCSHTDAESKVFAEIQGGGVQPACAVQLTWVPIPAGSFEMGCVPGDAACQANLYRANEHPRHTVTLTRPFWLMTTEVTVGQFRASAVALPEQPVWSKSERSPVVNVTWDEATRFCQGAGGRLPTEAEWEYAARGGRSGALCPWGNEAPVCQAGAANGARFKDCGVGGALIGGTFGANGYGLYDMAGNVWEWVADWYEWNWYGVSPSTDPRGPSSGQSRVLRGGSFDFGPLSLRVSGRYNLGPGSRNFDFGFRCARDVAP